MKKVKVACLKSTDQYGHFTAIYPGVKGGKSVAFGIITGDGAGCRCGCELTLLSTDFTQCQVLDVQRVSDVSKQQPSGDT